jgi:hypothetical protein
VNAPCVLNLLDTGPLLLSLLAPLPLLAFLGFGRLLEMDELKCLGAVA